MNVLVVGGSGKVGRLVLPALAARHRLRVLDLVAPETSAAVEYRHGSVCDFDALRDAVEGMDALLYMAMGRLLPVKDDERKNAQAHADAYDVSVKGLHLALYAAHAAGVPHAVYTSSLSVYHQSGAGRYLSDEDLTPDARHFYGFTKRLGEEVCRNAARQWGLSVNALRLCFPVSDDEWRERARLGEPTIRTAASDVARVLLGALEFQAGFQAFTISGDYEQKLMSLAKAKRLLGWEPLARPSRA